MYKRWLVWFRQDLRVQDNTALLNASIMCEEIIPIFIANSQITHPATEDDQRVSFLYDALQHLDNSLQQLWSTLYVYKGDATQRIPELLEQFSCDVLFYNESYGPWAFSRDTSIKATCRDKHIWVESYTDYLLVQPSLVEARKVYTPFYKKRLPKVHDFFRTWKYIPQWNICTPELPWEHLQDHRDLFPATSHPHRPLHNIFEELKTHDFSNYDTTRNIPSLDGTTKLSVYLRFWIVSPRLVYLYFAKEPNEWHTIIIKELAWREFWNHIALYFPYSIEEWFQKKRQTIERENTTQWFEAWKQGNTWYPIVDAGMRQLQQENRMHNRVRMIVASFLTKDLLIDRRRWAQHFANYLLDHDCNINTWNRQRSASVWADPKPLRIFNPILQSKRFDPDCTYILKYVPELLWQKKKAIHDPIKYDLDYTTPLVDHYVRSKEAKKRYNESKARYEKSNTV
jgi:deoxyribodipyrimidine photo-lyase